MIDGLGFIDNTMWLAGYAAFERGEPCPWDFDARAGWVAARADHEDRFR